MVPTELHWYYRVLSHIKSICAKVWNLKVHLYSSVCNMCNTSNLRKHQTAY